MPTNTTTAVLIGALAPIIAAAVVLFKLDLTQDQQAELVSGLAAIITVGATIYASVVHHSTAIVAVARAQNVGSVQARDQGDAKSVVATQTHDAKK